MRTRLMPVLIAAVLSLALAGCLVQTTIDAKGGGTLKAEMRGAKNTTLDAAKRGFQGPGVTITKATMDADKHAVIEIAYKDFRTLSQLGQFNNVKFTMTDDAKAKNTTAEIHIATGGAAALVAGRRGTAGFPIRLRPPSTPPRVSPSHCAAFMVPWPLPPGKPSRCRHPAIPGRRAFRWSSSTSYGTGSTPRRVGQYFGCRSASTCSNS